MRRPPESSAEPAERPVSHRKNAPTKRTYRRRRIIVGLAAAVVVVLVGTVAFVVYTYNDLSSGIHRSAISMPTGSAAPGVAQNSGESNILVMGLDSRLDENGNPLPAAMYNALHSGDESDGGYNTNVLMLIHIPAGGGRAVGISIPRDDYASLPGSPDGVSNGKIKEAYGLMLDQTLRHIVNTQANVSHADAYQQARTAARQEEITTVSQFLGGVPINHFIEITMAAFYKLAVAVQPVEVCLNAATSDTYSGANFHAGLQELSASQAVSFVRQRRDTSNNGPGLTDLDRERRQQAFIISLATKLRHQNVFTNFPLMQSLIDTAKQDVALDSGFDLLSFASVAQKLAGGALTFNTLPITGYATLNGEDVNLVDLPAIQATTKQLIAASDASSHATASSKPATKSTKKASSRSGAPTSSTPSPSAPSPSSTPGSLSPAPVSSGGIPCVN